MANQINTRLLALEVLVDVEKKNIFVKDALNQLLFQKQFFSKQDRAFISRLVEGVTEYRVRLDYLLNQFSKTPVSKCKPVIRCILRMAVYQIMYMNSVPDGTACDEAVKLARKKGFHNLAGFVNGVLRNIVREKNNIVYPSKEENIILFLSIEYSTPEWLVKTMVSWYGAELTEQILQSYIDDNPLTVRVNTNHISKEDFIHKLEQHNIKAYNGNYVDEALHLENINYVNRIPGYHDGDFFVQDESSMLVYHVADAQTEISNKKKSENTKLNILDLCAAPGGKTTHFAQMLGEAAHIKARDLSEKKIQRILENLERLGCTNVETVVWDALVNDPSLKESADIVIADLPCSGLGIVSKKNDIKYQISQEQLLELANLQKTILANAALYVKPGGLLLFSTCTINPDENVENANWFLSYFDFEPVAFRHLVPECLHAFMPEEHLLQLIPGQVLCDGFFISKFRKKQD